MIRPVSSATGNEFCWRYIAADYGFQRARASNPLCRLDWNQPGSGLQIVNPVVCQSLAQRNPHRLAFSYTTFQHRIIKTPQNTHDPEASPGKRARYPAFLSQIRRRAKPSEGKKVTPIPYSRDKIVRWPSSKVSLLASTGAFFGEVFPTIGKQWAMFGSKIANFIASDACNRNQVLRK